MYHLTRKRETPKIIPAVTLSRRTITRNPPYLNNNNQPGPKPVSDLDIARIRTAMTAIAAKGEKIASTSEQQHQALVKVEVVEQHPIKSDPGSGVDSFIAIMVHASKCE